MAEQKDVFQKTKKVSKRECELDLLREFVELAEQMWLGKSVEGVSRESERPGTAKPKKDKKGNLLLDEDGNVMMTDNVRTKPNLKLQRIIDNVELRYQVRVAEGSRLALTDEGRSLIAKAQRALEAFDNLGKPYERSVRISANDAGVHFWLPPAMAEKRFLQQSNIDVNIDTRESWDAVRDVMSGVADFGMGVRVLNDKIDQIPLFYRDHVAVVRKGEPLSDRPILDLREFTDITLVGLRDYLAPLSVRSVIQKNNLGVRFIALSTSAQVATWVQNRLGIGILCEDMIPPNSNLVQIPITPTNAFPIADDVVYVNKKTGIPDHAKSVFDQFIQYWKDHPVKPPKKRT